MTGHGTLNGRNRVLFYNHSGDVSGAEISLLLTIQHLNGVAVTLAAPEGELLTRARSEGISVIPVRSHRARMSSNPIQMLRGVIGTALTGFRLRRIIRRHQPDIVHANSIRAGLITLVGTFGLKVPVIWHVRDNMPNNFVGRRIRQLAEKHVASVFVISNAIAENFSTRAALRKKTTVVYNGIQTKTSTPLPVQDVREELQSPKESFVVGVIGQIALWKRQSDALVAFSRFCKSAQSAELWVVGNPKFRKENVTYFEALKVLAKQEGIERNVRFLGHRDDILDVMQAIDVLLVPSENEPFGRVVIEAMLSGKPVIGTRGGGIPEIIRDGETGFLVDIGDIQAMEQLLQWIYCSKDLRRMLGESGRARCVDRFSIETTSAEIMKTYQSITNFEERRDWIGAATEPGASSQ